MQNKKLDIPFLILIVLFLIVGLYSWRMYFKTYRQKDTVSIHEFPKVIGGWASEELVITDDEKAILETDNVFTRRYSNEVEGKEVYLFIVYSQNNRKVAHPPEICYTGAGASVLSSVHDSFPAASEEREIGVNSLTVEMGRHDQIFFYWFKVGDTYTSNYWKQQGLIALKSFLGKPSGSAMIRISADIKGGDKAKAVADLKEFGELIEPLLREYLP